MNTATWSLVPVRREGAWRAVFVALAALPLLGLLVFVAWPLVLIVLRSITGDDHAWTFARYAALLASPRILQAGWHSLVMGATVTAISVSAGFVVAFALHRSRLRGKAMMRFALLLPILSPSLVQALGIIFLLGRAGLVHQMTGWNLDLYGFWGLVFANACYGLPQVVLIVSSSLAGADRRYYDGAEVLGASRWRQFLDITLPQCRYALVAAAFVVFTVTVTDFGNAIVIGGRYRVLATEIYAAVAGQLDFGLGAAIGTVLLLPAVLSIAVERIIVRRSGRVADGAMVVQAPRNVARDIGLGLVAFVALAPIVATTAIVVYASFARLWPYKLGLTLANYHVNLADGFAPIVTSLEVSLLAALVGTALLFSLALAQRRMRGPLAAMSSFLALLPAAIPGLVLGIGYLVAFNDGPLSGWLYGSIAILVACNFYHYHAQGYLAMVAGLRNVPQALEEVAQCLGAGTARRIGEVVLPYAAPTMASVFFFLFMRSMVTLSGVVFLVTPALNLAAVAVMQLDMNGSVSQAAAYATCVMVVTGLAVAAMRLAAARASMMVKRSRHVA